MDILSLSRTPYYYRQILELPTTRINFDSPFEISRFRSLFMPHKCNLATYIPVLPWFTAWWCCSSWCNRWNCCWSVWSTTRCKWHIIQSDVSLISRTTHALYYNLVVYCADQRDLCSSPDITLFPCMGKTNNVWIQLSLSLTATLGQKKIGSCEKAENLLKLRA